MKKMTTLDMTALKNGAILECADGDFRILIDGASYNPNTEDPYDYIIHKRDGKFVGKSGIDKSVVGVQVFVDTAKEKNELSQALRYIHGLDTTFKPIEIYRAISAEKQAAMAELDALQADFKKMEKSLSTMGDVISKKIDTIKNMN